MNATRRPIRDGKILVLTGLLLTVLLGMAALAVDLGVIMSTRTQLQSASDSGSLAGGTELLAGLGATAHRTPGEVKTNAETQAVSFVAKHPAGEATASIIAARDVKMGTASMDSSTGVWSFVWGASPYNAVGVTTRRSSVGSAPGDRQLPLIFGPVIGTTHADITVDSVAVILPASGIHIPPGSTITSGLSPFAFSLERWRKYLRAVDYFDLNGTVPDHTVLDPRVDGNGDQYLGPDGQPEPLFYEMVKEGNNYVPRRLFDDQFGLTPVDSTNVTAGGDGILELNIYPLNSSAGNFGTIDVGNPNNSTSDLVRQIYYGINADDLSYFPDSTFDPQLDDSGIVVKQIDTTGDTGISSGIEDTIEKILGHPRAITLYSSVANPGNNALYTLVDIVGIRFMDIDLHGNPKTVIVQPASVSDPAGTPDFDDDIGTETTFFTPLILAK